MAREVFDQARPCSTKAQRFADAFKGCEEWTVPPRKPRSMSDSVFNAEESPFDSRIYGAEIIDLNSAKQPEHYLITATPQDAILKIAVPPDVL